MSIQAVAWALELEIPDALAKLVLVSLANHADHKTGRAHPSLETVCREASSARRTVQEKIRFLERKRFLRIVPDYDPRSGRQRANSYFLRLGMVDEETAKLAEAESLIAQGLSEGEGAPDAPSLFETGGGCGVPHGEGAPRRTGEGAPCCIPNKEPSEKEPPEETESHPDLPAGKAKIFFDPSKRNAILESVCLAIGREGLIADDAAVTHNAAEAALKAAGFAVEREVKVPSRGTPDGRGGRLDLVARRGSATIAIELDRETMRATSLVKLSQVTGLAGKGEGYRVGVLRKGGVTTTCPAGLDALVVLEPPAPPPKAIWIEADTVAWAKACELTGHKPTLHSPASNFGGRRGWAFHGDKLEKLPADVRAQGRPL